MPQFSDLRRAEIRSRMAELGWDEERLAKESGRSVGNVIAALCGRHIGNPVATAIRAALAREEADAPVPR